MRTRISEEMLVQMASWPVLDLVDLAEHALQMAFEQCMKDRAIVIAGDDRDHLDLRAHSIAVILDRIQENTRG